MTMRVASVGVVLDPTWALPDVAVVRPTVPIPRDMYWLFSACNEEWGNDHRQCIGDFRFRGFRSHCVCGCHRTRRAG